MKSGRFSGPVAVDSLRRRYSPDTEDTFWESVVKSNESAEEVEIYT